MTLSTMTEMKVHWVDRTMVVKVEIEYDLREIVKQLLGQKTFIMVEAKDASLVHDDDVGILDTTIEVRR